VEPLLSPLTGPRKTSRRHKGDEWLMNRRHAVNWIQPDGRIISCEEKLKVLDENLTEIRQMCQDAFEDALLLGCDESQVRAVLLATINTLHNPHLKK
jgi:hypothetical protein